MFSVADPRGGAPGALPPPPTAQNFLNFMQFLGKFDKIVCRRPLEGRRPSYRESWIRPWFCMATARLIWCNVVVGIFECAASRNRALNHFFFDILDLSE